MARIPQEKIEEIRESVDIVDVIGQYISLTKAGRNYKAICPFHEDTHPSLSISQQKQIYRCFVCGNGGNVFTFLQNYLHISFLEAVKMVADMSHIDLSDYHIEHRQEQVPNEFQVYYDMHKEANQLYRYYLNTQLGNLARDYLDSRGFSEDIIKTFEVGYAPQTHILFDAFKKLGYKEIDMVKSGLVIESQRHYDRFSDRVMFPLHDEYGRVVGFSGRIYKNGQEGAKYMNSPESDIFIKGQVLYNYHRCKEAVKKEGFVYLNEGFMDVIAMTRAHHGNCLALMGTALTQGHLRLLKRLTNHIVVCLDGDAPGQAAAYKATTFLSENGFDVKVVILPDGRDPDEIFTHEGQNALDRCLKDTLTPIEFTLKHASAKLDLNNYEDRRKFLDQGIKAIATITDRIDRDHYTQELSKLSGFSAEIIKEQLNEEDTARTPTIDYYHQAVTHVSETAQILDKYDQAERNLLFYMLSDRQVADRYEAQVGFMYNDTYRILASYIVDYYRHHAVMDEAELIDRIGDHQDLIQSLLSISHARLPLPAEKQAIDDYIRIISQNAMKMKKDQLLEQFRYVLDPQQKAKILQEMINLKKE